MLRFHRPEHVRRDAHFDGDEEREEEERVGDADGVGEEADGRRAHEDAEVAEHRAERAAEHDGPLPEAADDGAARIGAGANRLQLSKNYRIIAIDKGTA